MGFLCLVLSMAEEKVNVGLIFVPIFTRYLVVADYGVLSWVNVFLNLLIVMVPLGLGNAVIRLVFDAEDPEEERRIIGTGLTGQNTAPPDLSEAERLLFERIGAYPVHVDDLVRGTRMAAGTVASTLLQLELKGLIVQQPGKQFIRSREFLTPAK